MLDCARLCSTVLASRAGPRVREKLSECGCDIIGLFALLEYLNESLIDILPPERPSDLPGKRLHTILDCDKLKRNLQFRIDDMKATVSTATPMNTQTAIRERSESRERPQTPWPLVQPLPRTVPIPTMSPPATSNGRLRVMVMEGGAASSA